MNRIIATAAAAILVALAGPAQALSTAPSVTYFMLSAPSLTIEASGPTTLDVVAGATFTLSGTWSGGGVDSQCPSCMVQAYLAALAPMSGQINLSTNINSALITGGSYSGDFLAPETPGTYYIGAARTYGTDFQENVEGFANPLTEEVSYIVNVSEVSTPEPISAALLAPALLGLFARRRRS